MELASRIKGALLGGAIGDAMGFPFEREENVYTDNGIFFPWTYRYRNRFRSLSVPLEAGSYSDDTQMTLMAARSYRSTGVFDAKHFSAELREWLNYSIGAGKASKKAAKSTDRSGKQLFPFYKGYAFAGGNGAVMRALPHAAANSSNYDSCIRNGINDCLMTHGHPHAILMQVYYLSLLFALLNGGMLMDSIHFAEDHVDRFSLDETGIPEEWYEKWNEQTGLCYNAVENAVKDYLLSLCDALSYMIKEQPALNDAFKCLNAIGREKGSAIHSALAAIYAVKRHEEEGFMKCVYPVSRMKGCDTDTVASLIGTLFGAAYGIESVDKTFISTVQDSDYLMEIADRLLASSFSLSSMSERTGSLKRHKANLEELRVGQNLTAFPFGHGIVTGKTISQNTLIVQVRFDIGQSIRLTKTAKQAEPTPADLGR